MAEGVRALYEWAYKGLMIAVATALYILGLSVIVYFLSIGSEALSSGIGSVDGSAPGRSLAQGFYSFLNTALWVFAITAGVIFSTVYAVYIIDLIRRKYHRETI